MTTPQDSPDPEAEVLGHTAADDSPEKTADVVGDDEDESGVQAHAGWGTAG